MRMRPLPLLLQLLLLFAYFCEAEYIKRPPMTVLEARLSDSTDGELPFFALGLQAGLIDRHGTSMIDFTVSTANIRRNAANLGQSIVDAVKSANAILVFGLYDDDATQAVMQSTAFSDANLVLFGPYTQSTGVRRWNTNVYFMACDPMMELISLMNWYVWKGTQDRSVSFGNIGWMFLRGGVFDDTLPSLFANQLRVLGLREPYSYEHRVGSAFSIATFNSYMALKPTCMFLMGARGAHTISFFEALVQNTHVRDASKSFYIMMPFALMHSTGAAFQALKPANVLKVTFLRYAAPLPTPMDKTRGASAHFQSDALKVSAGHTLPVLSTTGGYMMYYGWVMMQQVYFVARNHNLGFSPHPFDLQRSVFQQLLYNFDDVVLGTYAHECVNEGLALKLGGACKCNQGGRYNAVVRLEGEPVVSDTGVNFGYSIVMESEDFFPPKRCYTDRNVQGGHTVIYGAAVAVQNDVHLASVGTAVGLALVEAAKASTYELTSPVTLAVPSHAVSAATSADAEEAVRTQTRATTLSVVFGPVAAPFTPSSMSDYFFVDPIAWPVLDHDPSPNVMHVSATLRQQINIVAGYLSTLVKARPSGIDGGVHARVRTSDSAYLINGLKESLGYYGVPFSTERAVGATVGIVDFIPTRGYTFVFGLREMDIEPLFTFLTKNLKATVIISFDDLTLCYAAMTSVFGAKPLPFMSRLLFATNMPSWTDASSSGTIFQKFVSNMGAASCSPAAMRAFVGAMALDKITAKSKNISSASLPRALNNLNYLTIKSMTLGPYSECHVIHPLGCPLNGPVNYGARDVSLWSYTRVVNPDVDPVVAPQTLTVYSGTPILVSETLTTTTTTTTAIPTTSTTTTTTTTTTSTLPPCHLMTTTTKLPTKPPSTTNPSATTKSPTINGSEGDSDSEYVSNTWEYVLLVLLTLLLVAAVLFAIHLCCTVLPCFGGEPMHCAPVDCDAATTVVFVEVEKWSDVQRAVPEASAECVAEYRNIVRRLVEKHDCYECGSWMDAFMVVSRHADRALKFAAALQKELDGMRGPPVDAVDAAYAGLGMPSSACVRGLRVRVGVHTDVVDIAYDVDTDHYEYRGSGCVAALRTERLAHGGQVLVTGATCEALTEKQLACVSAVSVGTHSFDEYDDPVEVFELVVLPQREFGSVHPHPVPLACGERLLTMCVDGEKRGTTDDVALAVEVLALSHDGFPWAERVQLLRWSCEQCGLRVPPHASGVSNRGYEAILLQLLAEYSCSSRSSMSGGVNRVCKEA